MRNKIKKFFELINIILIFVYKNKIIMVLYIILYLLITNFILPIIGNVLLCVLHNIGKINDIRFMLYHEHVNIFYRGGFILLPALILDLFLTPFYLFYFKIRNKN